MTHPQPIVGRVNETEDAPPLELWVAASEGPFLQRELPVPLVIHSPQKTRTNGGDGPFGG